MTNYMQFKEACERWKEFFSIKDKIVYSKVKSRAFNAAVYELDGIYKILFSEGLAKDINFMALHEILHIVLWDMSESATEEVVERTINSLAESLQHYNINQ